MAEPSGRGGGPGPRDGRGTGAGGPGGEGAGCGRPTEERSQSPLAAWHLPGLELAAARSAWHHGTTAGGAPFRSPRLSARQAAAAARKARRAALEARRARDVRSVIRCVSGAALALADPATPAGREAAALLERELGWPRALTSETLGGMAAGWSEPSLLAVVEAELGDPELLDGFRPAAPAVDPVRPGFAFGPSPAAPGGPGSSGPPAVERSRAAPPRRRRRHAVGPPLIFQVEAGNLPGVGITGVIRALIARSGVLVKLPEDAPGLTPLFARELAAADPLLGLAVAAAWWPGADTPPAWAEWVKHSGKVVVYGGAEAVLAARRAAPPHAEVISYGPRLGVAVVFAGGVAAPSGAPKRQPSAGGGRVAPSAAEAEEEEVAARLARDVCAYEQGGCVSPRLVFVVGGRAAGFASRLGEALEGEVARLRPPRPGAAVAAAIRRARAAAEFGAYAGAGRGSSDREPEAEGGPASAQGGVPAPAVLGPAELSWTLLVSESAELGVEALPRVARVCAVRDVAALLAALAPLEGRIQALGYAGAGEGEARELAEGASRLGVSRVAPLGTLAWPPPDWRHDGRHQLLPLLRWTEWEEET